MEVEDANFGSRGLSAVVQPVHTGAGGVAGHDGAEPEGEVLGLLGELLTQCLGLDPAQCRHLLLVGLKRPVGHGPQQVIVLVFGQAVIKVGVVQQGSQGV